jgi:hypothetical protein
MFNWSRRYAGSVAVTALMTSERDRICHYIRLIDEAFSMK